MQNDKDNRRLTNVIIAMITSRTDRAGIEATQLYIDITTSDGDRSGLLYNSAVNCVNLLTVHQQRVRHVIGNLPSALMSQVDNCLRAALELS